MSNSNQQSDNSGEGDQDDPCVICLGEINNRSTTDVCSHQFCFQCIERWAKERNTCPVCKRQFAEIFYDFKEDNTHNTLKVQNTDIPGISGEFFNIVELFFLNVVRLFNERDIDSLLRNPNISSHGRQSMFTDISRQIDLFNQQLRTHLNRDSNGEQSGQDVPRAVSPENGSDSERTEGLTGRFQFHIIISTSSPRAGPTEESNPNPNPEETEESTQTEPSTSNKRPRPDEDDQSEPQSKRSKN